MKHATKEENDVCAKETPRSDVLPHVFDWASKILKASLPESGIPTRAEEADSEKAPEREV